MNKTFSLNNTFLNYLRDCSLEGFLSADFFKEVLFCCDSDDFLTHFRSFFNIDSVVRNALTVYLEDVVFDNKYFYNRVTGDRFTGFKDVESLIWRFVVRKGGIVTHKELDDELGLNKTDYVNNFLDRLDNFVDKNNDKVFVLRYFKGDEVSNSKRNGRHSTTTSKYCFLFIDIDFFIKAKGRFLV